MNVSNVDPATLARIAGLRHGFLIADEVLRDTLADFARGGIDADELELALLQHRVAYNNYTSQLLSVLEPNGCILH